MRRARVLGLVSPSVACATTPTVTSERQAVIRAAADTCLPDHPTVARYDVNRFGQITAWYKENQGQTVATSTFFHCVRARLGLSPMPTAAPDAPVTGNVPTVAPASARPSSRTADRLRELDGLRQQRLISEEEYQTTRKRILEGL